MPQTEAEIVKRENNELKQELSELRKTMLRQEQNFNKKIGNTRQDPVEDWKKGQIDKLHRQLAEAEQRVSLPLAVFLLFNLARSILAVNSGGSIRLILLVTS